MDPNARRRARRLIATLALVLPGLQGTAADGAPAAPNAGARARPASPASAQPTTIGPMTVNVPSAWVPRPGPPGDFASFGLPGTGPGAQAVVMFSAGPDAGANQAEGHRMLWSEVVRLTGAPKRQRSGQAGRFAWSEMHVTNLQTSQDEWHRVYSTREGDQRVMAGVAAQSETAFEAAVAALQPVLATAEFGVRPGAAAAPGAAAPGADARTAAAAAPQTGAAAAEVPIVEAHVHVDTRSITNTSNVLTDHILFFGNGIVAREGVITGPRECYVLYDVRQLAKLPLNYGRWREDRASGTVQIQWQEGPPWTLRRDAGRLSLDGRKLLPLRALDGLKLDGVYEYRPVGDPPSRLELRSDGRFAAADLRERMGCPMQAPPGALAGTGHYEVRKWTLILRFSDGRVTLLPMHVESGEELRSVAKFWLNGHDFVRLR